MGSGWKEVPAPAPQSKVEIQPEKLQAIRDGLWMVVNQAGTGRNALAQGLRRRGQDRHRPGDFARGRQGGQGEDHEEPGDHGWFVFLAPRDNPQIAGVIFAEHGEHGSTAAIVARHALETFFAKKEGQAAAAAARPSRARRAPPADGDDPPPASRSRTIPPASPPPRP